MTRQDKTRQDKTRHKLPNKTMIKGWFICFFLIALAGCGSDKQTDCEKKGDKWFWDSSAKECKKKQDSSTAQPNGAGSGVSQGTPESTATKPTGDPAQNSQTPAEPSSAQEQASTEYFTLYVPEEGLYPRYSLIFYTSDGHVGKTVRFHQGSRCAKVHKNHLTLITVKKTKGIPRYLPIPPVHPNRVLMRYEDVTIYETGRSGYRVGIYKPSKTDDSLIKVSADDPEYLRYKDKCYLREPS